jgi:hypothetical protein
LLPRQMHVSRATDLPRQSSRATIRQQTQLRHALHAGIT